jgi:ubiquinone/menaquinone biosynthesis C-methylase UbiE
MDYQEKLQVESSKWDNVATKYAPTFRPETNDFHRHAEHTIWGPQVSAFLGDLEGKRVLEIGCGLGRHSVLLAKSGASVTSFDLSLKSVVAARERAAMNAVGDNVAVVVAAAEALPFADASFDIIFGRSILHHLEVFPTLSELHRVLRPKGKAAFVEPMGMNPVLNFAREHIPYRHKNPRGADRPLNYADIKAWCEGFREVRYFERSLLGMLERAFGFGHHFNILRMTDDFLLKKIPGLKRYCRTVIMLLLN